MDGPLFTMDALLVLRFLKLVSVVALSAGTMGVFVSRHWEDRQRMAFWIAAPGFAGTWIFGIWMAHGAGVSLLASWIVGAAALSLLSINCVLFVAGREGRRVRWPALIAIGSLLGAMGLMVWKP